MVAGEESAFREAYETFAPALLRLLERFLGRRSLAEEVLHETLASAFHHIRAFRREARLSTWLSAIALRRAHNAVRAEARRDRSERAYAELSPLEPAVRDAEALLEEAEQIERLLDALPDDTRAALLMTAEGFTAQEISALTGAPRGTVLSRVFRGRARLDQG